MRRWGWLVILAFGLGLLYLAKSVLTPFLIALLLAYAFDPLIGWMERVRIPRSWGAKIVLLIITAMTALFLFFILPIIQNEITLAVEKFPAYLERIREQVLPYLESKFGWRAPKTLDETMSTYLPRLKEEGPAIFRQGAFFIVTLFTGAFGFLVGIINLIVIPFAFYYFLKDFDRMKQAVWSLVPPRFQPEVGMRFRELDRSLSGFIRGQLLIVLVLAGMYGVALALIGVDLAFVLGAFAGLMEIVPYFGFTVGLSLSLLVTFLQFQDLTHLVYVVLAMGAIQAIQGLIIGPKILGSQVGLHPLLVIAAIYIGGDLFGFIGILLAVPGMAALVVLVKALADYYRRSPIFEGTAE
jgi:predicted PurR-regulated permease PerM